MSMDLLLSVVTGLVGLLAAVMTSFLAMRRQRDLARYRAEAETIAKSVEQVEAAQRARVLELATERIPPGLTAAQFTELLNSLALRISAPPPGEGDAVEKLISGYHGQALSQAQAQFWFSIVAATVGFAWILYGGSEISAENLATTSRILPGVVLDAVAFLFFRQASETRQRATELYDRLRRDKQMAESVALVSSIEDIRVRSAVKAQMALHMSGIEPAPIELTKFLSGPKSGDEPDAQEERTKAAT